jgi:hypothetical protein
VQDSFIMSVAAYTRMACGDSLRDNTNTVPLGEYAKGDSDE